MWLVTVSWKGQNKPLFISETGISSVQCFITCSQLTPPWPVLAPCSSEVKWTSSQKNFRVSCIGSNSFALLTVFHIVSCHLTNLVPIIFFLLIFYHSSKTLAHCTLLSLRSVNSDTITEFIMLHVIHFLHGTFSLFLRSICEITSPSQND